jgi:hypothetical protein
MKDPSQLLKGVKTHNFGMHSATCLLRVSTTRFKLLDWCIKKKVNP